MYHHEGFDFVPGNQTLSAVEAGLVNMMSRETVLRWYIDSIRRDYNYVLLDYRPSLGILAINALRWTMCLSPSKRTSWRRRI